VFFPKKMLKTSNAKTHNKTMSARIFNRFSMCSTPLLIPETMSSSSIITDSTSSLPGMPATYTL
jgi:hypothetical protein